MNKVKRLVVLIAIILLGCSSSLNPIPSSTRTPSTSALVPTDTPTTLPTTPTPNFAQIRFDDDQIAKLQTDRFLLYLVGIAAVDSSELFIYGDIENSVGSGQRSVILKSEDQGHTWDEIFAPIENNSILFVSFIDQSCGWLLSAWTIEMIGKLQLYQTTDGGKNWNFVSNIPMWQWYGHPSRMQFFTPEFGEMDFVYIGGAPGTDKISFMSTSDGGITWTEAASLPVNPLNLSVYDSYRRTLPRPFVSFGSDESIWMLNDRRVSDTHYFYELQAKMQELATWQVLIRIAEDYTYKDGKVSITK